MRSKVKFLPVVLVIAGLAITGWWKRDEIGKLIGGKPEPEFQTYTSKPGKFTFAFPNKWEVEEATPDSKFVARVMFTPTKAGQVEGNISQISVTIVSSPSANQPFSKQNEFLRWYTEAAREVKGKGIIKLANETVAGEKAVRLAEVDIVEEAPDKSFWSVTTWFRKSGINYYLNMMGNGKLTDMEQGIFSQLLSTFVLE